MTALRVAVLTPPDDDGSRPDMEDTHIQAWEISACLLALGHEPHPAFFEADRRATSEALRAMSPDLVFNLVEDVPEGPDQVHLATALLDRLGLKFTGASTAALAALGDKTRMKAVLKGARLPVAAGLAEAAEDAFFIVKSAIEHASLGLDAGSVVAGRGAALARIAERQARFGGYWFAETFIDGREFNVGVLQTEAGPIALPVAEIAFLGAESGPRIVGYDEKWATESAAYAQTPRVFPEGEADAHLLRELQRLSLSAWSLFGLAGYARVDFRVGANGSPVILEVNANPCLAADAGFCAAARVAGMSQRDVVAHLVTAAHG